MANLEETRDRLKRFALHFSDPASNLNLVRYEHVSELIEVLDALLTELERTVPSNKDVDRLLAD